MSTSELCAMFHIDQEKDERWDPGRISYAASKAIEAHRTGGFYGASVEGGPREGKTVYAIKTMRDIFKVLNPELSVREAYHMAIQNLHLQIEGFLDFVIERQMSLRAMLPKIDWSLRAPIKTLDDGSLYAGTMLYFKDPEMYDEFQSTMTTIGTCVSSIFVTCPTHESLTKPLKDYYHYDVIKITRTSGGDRVARVQEWYRKKNNQYALRAAAEDVYTPHVPNEIYASYLNPRMGAALEAAKKMRARREARIEAKEEKAKQEKPPVATDPALKAAIEQVLEEQRKKRPKRGKWTTLPAPPAQNQPANTSGTGAL